MPPIVNYNINYKLTTKITVIITIQQKKKMES